MSKINNSVRQRAVKRRQVRRTKVAKLRVKYEKATGEAKTKILAKVLKVNPNLTKETFITK